MDGEADLFKGFAFGGLFCGLAGLDPSRRERAQQRSFLLPPADQQHGAIADDDGRGVICWPRLSVDAVETELHRLGEWIVRLVARYSLDHRTIPPCWHRHGALIEELCALRGLWHACYGPDATLADPINFHQHLGLAMQRLRDWTARRDCKPGQHRDDQPPVWHGIDD